jgi:hypothetical protein
MYIVLNHENNIIALDNATLQLFKVKNIMELYQKLSRGLIEFFTKDNLLTIATEASFNQYRIESKEILGAFGENELIIIKDDITANKEINLKDLAPIKIDFSLEKSSEELGLPKDITIEFIKSFNEQCRTQTEDIIDAYKTGDMDKIYQIAYELRLGASNLFISPIAESLLRLQYNKDKDKVPYLVEKYWAQFISFENQIKNMQ